MSTNDIIKAIIENNVIDLKAHLDKRLSILVAETLENLKTEVSEKYHEEDDEDEIKEEEDDEDDGEEEEE